ncbi:hypothetical protein K2X33_16450 [bacterium]|nr:hypothetical protein [bacterium]
MPKPVANLKRFKSSMQGIREFAILIEQSDPRSRAMILESAEKEDARFLAKALRKVVYFEEFQYLEEGILAEILAKASPKVLAFALIGMSAEFTEYLHKQLGFREKKMLRDEQENMKAASEAFILGARAQVLKVARSLEAQNKFVFELNDCPRFKQRRSTG